MVQYEWDQNDFRMKYPVTYSLKLPIFQWLLLVFLSAGLTNDAFYYQSTRPVSGIETVFTDWLHQSKIEKEIHSSVPNRRKHQPKTIHLQTIKYLFLSQKLNTLHKISFLHYPENNHFPFPHIATLVNRQVVIFPDDAPFTS